MQRIDLAQFLIIAEYHTGIDAHTLARMDRVVVLAQSALAAPFAGFGEIEVFPSFEAKAGIYCARISNYQPLPDGNKRTGYDVMIEFVQANGRTWTHGPGGLDETAQMIRRVSGDPPPLTEEAFLAWVAQRIS